MKLLPDDYKNIWLEDKNQWFTYEDLKQADPSTYLIFVNMSYEEDMAIIFLSKKLSNTNYTFAIVYCDVVAHKEDYAIEGLSILGYTNEDNADFGLNLNPLAQKINNYQKLSAYQFAEKFYIGECEKISVLKEKISKILKFTWTNDESIIAF